MFQYSFTEEDGSGFGSWKTVPAVPVPRSVPAKTVPTVPVSGSGSVRGPPCFLGWVWNEQIQFSKKLRKTGARKQGKQKRKGLEGI